MVWEEARICVDRQNRNFATEGVILQSAILVGIGAFGKDGGKKAAKSFGALIEKLNGDDDPASAKINMTDLINKDRKRDGSKRRRDQCQS